MVKVLDPHTPVIIGAGQVANRPDRGDPEVEPIELIARAARAAAADSGAARVLAELDSVRVVKMLSWRYRDPGALVAGLVGAAPRQSVYTTDGGQTPVALLNRTALDIAAGELDVALLCGGETWRTRQRYRTAGEVPPWTPDDGSTPVAETFGADLDMVDAAELARGMFLPVQVYALFDVALRAAAGRTPDEHLAHLGRLWSRFSEIAAANPNAWLRTVMTPEEVITPTPDNRLIGYPYTLVMNSNNNVEQSAALLVCSAEKAESFGVPRDRWVFPLVGAEANDTAHVSQRGDLRSSPAVRAAGRALFAAAGLGVEDLGPVDLYSCFPSAVQIAADELGLGAHRDLTVTGGMGFAGGPWNNYATHGLATMVDRLREEPGAVGLCTGNGGLTTKHALALLSTEPAAEPFRRLAPQDEVDAAPQREVVGDDHEGPITVEAYTVMHGRDGTREVGFVAGLLADGRRTWCSSDDADLLATLVHEECCGRRAHRRADGTVALT